MTSGYDPPSPSKARKRAGLHRCTENVSISALKDLAIRALQDFVDRHRQRVYYMLTHI